MRRSARGLLPVALVAGLLLAACAGAPEAAAPVGPTPADVAPPAGAAPATTVATPASAAAPAEPTASPAPAGPAPADWTQTVTQEGDYWVLGNPSAPVRMIDFSDFL